MLDCWAIHSTVSCRIIPELICLVPIGRPTHSRPHNVPRVEVYHMSANMTSSLPLRHPWLRPPQGAPRLRLYSFPANSTPLIRHPRAHRVFPPIPHTYPAMTPPTVELCLIQLRTSDTYQPPCPRRFSPNVLGIPGFFFAQTPPGNCRRRIGGRSCRKARNPDTSQISGRRPLLASSFATNKKQPGKWKPLSKCIPGISTNQ